MHEWPLLLFTILVQIAIGGTLALYYFQKKLQQELDREQLFVVLKPAALTLATLSVVGVGASFFHLGSPGHAFYLLRHFSSSWMSREILMSGLFIFMLIVTVALGWKRKSFSEPLLIITFLIGLVAVWTMAASYADTIHSAWNHAYTYIAFYANTLTVGPLLVCALLYGKRKELPSTEKMSITMQRITLVALFVLLIQVVAAPSYLVGLAIGDEAEVATLGFVATNYGGLLALCGVLLLLGGLAAIVLLWQAGRGKPERIQTLLYISFLALFVGELLARYLFYASGLPLVVG